MWFIFIFNTNAQSLEKYFPKPNHPEWFKAIPAIDESTPEWAKVMYLEDDNFEKIERLKTEYYKVNKWEKNIHVQNYKFWLKSVQNYVGEDGKVTIPNSGIEFLKYEKYKKQKSAENRSATSSWVNLGPYETTNGSGNPTPTQANVFCLGVSPSNPSVVYAGMETGGIYKSTDKGLNWYPASETYAIGSPEEIKVDPNDPDIVYVVDGSSLYKSSDGGTSWVLHYSSSDVIEQLYIDTDNTSHIYAATRGGVLESTNGGTTWTSIFTGYIYDIEAKPGTNDTLYISIKNDVAIRPEIYISYDSGTNWTLKDNGFYSPSDLSNSTVYGCKIGVSPAAPDRIYAGIIASGKEGDNGWIGIYYSDDIGESWQNDTGVDGASIDNGDGTWSYPSGSDMNTNWYVGGYSSGYHQGWYNFDIDVSHNNADRLWIGTIWFCESANKGMNIEYIRGTRSLTMHADVQDIDVVGNDIWVASDGGLNYSDDECQTMQTRMKGMYASDFWGFGHGWNEDLWVGGRYHNGNAAFHENYGAGKTLFLGGAENPTGYVDQHDNRKTYYSDIGGRKVPDNISDGSPNIANLGLYPTESYFHFSYSEVEWHPYKGNVVYVGKNNHLYRSIDGGNSFNTLGTLPGDIRRFEISREDPNYIYAIAYVSYWDWRMVRSTDGGVTFTELPQPPITSGSWRNLSFTLNPFDKDEIWLASNSSDNGNKIFSSTDGGMTWTNRYDTSIENQGIKDMIYHGSTDGDKIYVMTNDNFFFFNKDDASWSSFNDGLPLRHTGFMTLPFYRDGKIRLASAKGIWETPFDGRSKVQAIPMIDNSDIVCSRDTSYLESYSIVNQDGATWQWTISPAPLYISDPTIRNPKVVFGNIGSYDVTLSVTDANGETDSRTVANFVTLTNLCEPETVAGKSLKTTANGQSVAIRDANLNNITHFTVTGWWKPDGAQQAYSSLVSSGDWCAHCDYTEGLIYDYHGSRLWYKWPGNANNWAGNSGITIPENEWSYVALVITPTSATMYLNDQKYIHNKTLQPGNITDLYVAYGHYSKSFKGEIDEVTIWTKALTDDEIYELKHITKDDQIDNDPDLIAYYQFNDEINGSIIIDRAGSRHGVLHPDATTVESSAPVGGGDSKLIDLDPTQTEYELPEVGAKLYLSDCETPEGKIVVSRLNTSPDTINTNESYANQYWIINSISQNGEGFGNLDSIKLTTTDTDFVNDLNSATASLIYSRNEHDEGTTWTPQSKSKSIANNEIAYHRESRIKGDQQIILVNGNTSELEEIDPGKPCEVDTIPGKVLELPGNGGDYAEIPALNLNSNTITMSAWIKPNGTQNDWAGILFCRGGSTTSGLSILASNELRYHWNGGEWGWSSGAFAEIDKWNHVALVIQPTQITIYLNGVPYTRSVTHNTEEFDAILRIGNDAANSSRTFDGQIDEVCIWDRALSQNEIRSLRHLTKDDIIANDTNLIVYLQFNEDEGKIYDKTTYHNNSILRGNSSRNQSNAPVGGGVSDIHTINGSGIINSDSGLELVFGSSGTYPDGEIVLSRINLRPDTLPGIVPVSKSYWIINNYGTNQTFTALTSLTFEDTGVLTAYSNDTDFALNSRTDNDFGHNWISLDSSNTTNQNSRTITFDQTLNVSSFGQFVLEHQSAKGWIGIENTQWENKLNWGGGNTPNPIDEVIIPTLTPFSPEINTQVFIKSILLQSEAKVTIKDGSMDLEE